MSVLSGLRLCRPLLPRLQAVHHLVYLRTMSSSQYRPLVISGPSGCGKSTVLNRMFDEFPDTFAFSVSHTTRKPRPGEVEGKDYYYVQRDTFEEMINSGGFLEHAQFSGNRYGTSKQSVTDIQKTGRICILDVEINGVKNIKKTDLNPRYVFLKPPSIEVLKERLQGRGTETEESLKKRLDTAQEALEYADEEGAYDHVIVNDNLDAAYAKLRGIVIEDVDAMKKEKLKSGD